MEANTLGASMMRVCTGFNPAGYAAYGARALETFDQYWPKDVDLIAYAEEIVPMPRGECRSLWNIPGAREFVERYSDDFSAQGRAPCPKWTDKERKRYAAKPGAAYTYKYDALKFFKQCMIPLDASLGMRDGDILTWLDADVITIANVPNGFVDFLLGDSHDLCYLGRHRNRGDGDPDKLRGASSEIGFWAVRLNSATRQFLARFSDAWTTDRFKQYAEWHSAYVFDCTRMAFSELRMRNLTPGPRGPEGGHVWHSRQSPLWRYMDHLKGDRKTMDRSPEATRK